MTAPKSTHPARVLHRCCPNAGANLVGHRVHFDASTTPLGSYSWKVIAAARTATYPPDPGRMLSIVYCPWCGVVLEAWRLGRPNPLEPHAETLEESDAFLSAVLRDIRRRES